MAKGKPDTKRGRFVKEYLIDLNATQAAIRAGFSEKTAYSQGQRLLKDVEIQTAITKAQDQRSDRTEIKADTVLREIARLGLSDFRRLFTPGGNLLPPDAWDDDTAAAISSVEVVSRPTNEKAEDGGTVIEHVHKIKMWDKNSALDKLMKHLGEYAAEKREHTGKGGGPIETITRDMTPKEAAQAFAAERSSGGDD